MDFQYLCSRYWNVNIVLCVKKKKNSHFFKKQIILCLSFGESLEEIRRIEFNKDFFMSP